MKKFYIVLWIVFSFLAQDCFSQLTNGQQRFTVVTDSSGNVLSTPLTFTNQVQSLVTATAQYQIITYSTFTNSVFAITNNAILNSITNIANVGTGTGITFNVSNKIARFASIIPGNGITITNSGGTNLTIYSTSSGGGGSTNIQSNVPWLIVTNNGSTAYLNTNTTKIALSVTDNNASGLTNFPGFVVTNGGIFNVSTATNFPATLVTNMTSSTDSVVTWGGQGTRIFTPALNYGVLVTNNGIYSANGLTNFPAFLITNQVADAGGGHTITGQGTRVSTDTLNYNVLNTNGAAFSIKNSTNFPSMIVTNVTSSSATVTGQGTPVINIEVAASVGNAVTNGPNYFMGPFTNTFNGYFNITNFMSHLPNSGNFIYHDNGQPWADMNSDFGDTGIYWTNGQRAINIDITGASAGSISFKDKNGTAIASFPGTLSDASGGESIHVTGRGLEYGNGQYSAKWYNGGGRLENTWTNFGSMVVQTNLSVFGIVGIGTGSPASTLHVVTTNAQVGSAAIISEVYATTNITDLRGRRARGTVASPSGVISNDTLMAISGAGYGATGFTAGKTAISLRAGEVWNDQSNGTYVAITTTSNGTSTAVESFRLSDWGNLGLGTNLPTSRLHVRGNIQTDTLNALTPSTFVTNITASGATVTGQGTPVINISIPAATATMTTNTINAITSGAFGLSGSIWTNFGSIFVTNSVSAGNFISVNTNKSTRALNTFVTYPNPGQTFNIAYLAANYAGATPYDSILAVGDAEEAGNLYSELYTVRSTSHMEMDFQGGNFTAADFFFGTHKQIIGLGTGLTLGENASSAFTLNGTPWNWPNGLNAQSGGQFWPSSLTAIATNGWATNQFTGAIIVANTINGVTPANIATNVSGDSIFSFTGAGTRNYTLTPNYAINVTNGGSYTLGITTTSNLTVNGNTTLGDNSSSTLTIPGTAITAANGLNLNSGGLTIPSSLGLISTNGYSTNQFLGTALINGSVTTTNIVITSPDSWFRFTAGTATNSIMDGAGTIPQQNTFTFSTRTNTLTEALPVINHIYTNNAQRMTLGINVGTAVSTRFFLISISGTTTQFVGRVDSSIATTNTVFATIPPNALYIPSNSVGTTTLIPGEWNETRW